MGGRKISLWSPEAQTDIKEISEYYERVAGPQTSENVLLEIADAIDLLEAHPFGGRARHEIRPNLRSMPAYPHVIFYRILDEAVQIVRVLDARRDVDTQLGNQIGN